MNPRSTRRHVLIWGMMGSGKSTVGPMLAAHLNHPYVDLDTAIEADTNLSISDIFTHQGEAAFRERENALLRGFLDLDSAHTIALGGGALVDDELRAYAREKAIVVCLWASPKTLAERVGDDPGRPLLRGDPLTRLEHVLRARTEAYHDVDLVVATDSASPESVAMSVAAALRDQVAA